MRTVLVGFAASILSLHVSVGQIKVLEVKGDVRVRHDVQQAWLPVRTGDVLKPNDSMKSGKRSGTTVLTEGKKRVTLPENVVIDLSDLRMLTREELLLKLAMEKVRTLPQEQNDEPAIPEATVLHGTEKVPSYVAHPGDELGNLQLNGTRVLYNTGFYATCALKAKEVFRLYPGLLKKMEFRLMVASALEKESLRGEAITEYASLLNEGLSPSERETVQIRMARLKEKSD